LRIFCGAGIGGDWRGLEGIEGKKWTFGRFFQELVPKLDRVLEQALFLNDFYLIQK
jgi:hypothetical protein